MKKCFKDDLQDLQQKMWSKMFTISRFSIFRILLLWTTALTAAYAQRFLEEPTSETVAPNTVARFDCVVEGDDATHIQWKVNNKEPFTDDSSIEEGYFATWHTQLNSTLDINTEYSSANINGTAVRCIAIGSKTYHVSNIAHLHIAGRPLKPDGLQVFYDSVDNVVQLYWNTPFTHMPQFPILNYMADVEYLTLDRNTLKKDNISILGTKTDFSMKLNESDVCMSNRLCVSLRARNRIGYSLNTSITCITMEREHRQFPINASLTKQPNGETLVSVLYQRPQCFPQGIQTTLVVEEAPKQVPDITIQPLLAEGDVVQVTEFAKMDQDVVYVVTLNISSGTERASSLPAYVMLPSEASELDNGGSSGGGGTQVVIIAVIIGVLALAILIITALATSVAVLVHFHGKRKDTTVINQMQPNPFYENTYYDTIPDANFNFSRNRSPSYDSHIYQDMPELVRRLQDQSQGAPLSQVCSSSAHEAGEVEEMKRQQCTVVGVDQGVIERESDYVVMQSVTDSPTPLETDV